MNLLHFVKTRDSMKNPFLHEFDKMRKESACLVFFIKTNKIPHDLSLYYIKQIDYMLLCLFNNRSQKTSKCGKNIID